MPNEKIVNRENLKAFRQAYDERLKNGSLVPSKSLQAQSIQAVSIESGAIQETPFINQGTGTANGTYIVDTSPVGKHLEKQGNSVVVNQLINPSEYANVTTQGYLINGVTYTKLDDGWIGINGTATGGNASTGTLTAVNCIVGHKYLFIGTPSGGANKWGLGFGSGFTTRDTGSGFIYSPISNTTIGITFYVVEAYGFTNIKFKPNVIDLTQLFNGDIPQDIINNPSNFYRYYNGSLAYNTGSLDTSDGQYLECGQGRNLFDGTNDIKAIANATYYIYGSATLTYKDKDGNTISSESKSNETFIAPSNCDTIGVSGSGYICISLYYETGDGYDQYYPYIEPKVYDTGTEVLRSAGSVKDYKTPDGTIHRLVGRIKLKDLTFIKHGTQNYFYFTTYSAGISIKFRSSSYGTYIYPLSCSKYISSGKNDLTTKPFVMCVDGSSSAVVQVQFNGGNFTDATEFKNQFNDNDYLYYELDEPTTEQGTPFSENIEINDYSYMAWKNASDYVDVPQGCRIFYPADYVLFIDSVGQRQDINWDATKIVSQEQRTSDKNAQATVDNKLLENIGGALRHNLVLKVTSGGGTLDFNNTKYIDLGDQSWTYSNGSFVATISDIPQGVQYNVANVLCPLYATRGSYYLGNATWSAMDKAIMVQVSGRQICINDSSYTDATAFKNAMKNILLAYEKAS